MGGSLAYKAGFWMKLDAKDMRILLMMGIAGGFGAVFGTPVAGAVFALEVLAIGKFGDWKALIPCLLAAYLSDWVCHTWGVGHTTYHIAFDGTFDLLLFAKVLPAGAAFGFASRLFSYAMHRLKDASGKIFKKTPWLMPAAGGCIVIILTFIAGTSDYLGLVLLLPHQTASPS